MKGKSNLLWLLLLAVFIDACSERNPDPGDPLPDASSVYIINEGPFQSGTGDITVYDRHTKKVALNVFEGQNGRPLGNVVQSMELIGELGYIVVNNANKIEVVDPDDLKSVSIIENISLPRYISEIQPGIAYVTSWDNCIYCIDLSTNMITDTIPVGTGPEQILATDKYAFILNKGGLVTDSTVSVIDVDDNEVVKTLTLGEKPTGIVRDILGMIWILCHGEGWNGWPAAGDTPGRLIRINPQTLEVIEEYIFPDNVNHPERLAINENGDFLYYITPSGLYSMEITSESLPGQPLIARNASSFGLGFDPLSRLIYLANPLDFQQNGYVIRYTSQGALVDSFMVGIIPSGFCYENE